MKRHEALIPLSHDHHHGLLLAQLIKKNAPEYKDLPADLNGKIEYTLTAWEKELRYHFENEEKILFPAVRGVNDSIDNLIDEILAEHIEIEDRIHSLKDSENKIDDLDTLGILLNNHIRKEERELFVLIQEYIDEKTLNDLSNKIISAEQTCKLRS
ncbi:MAG: hemerythrin domain-containing protein [Melioribacteraceae bacterium]|nr:hemerythrin domain-containing protein [Melioribacteraceae bacterium]MCF8354131.1 hemerythrin domain-containing protein [Melioribacteraceae bacterium]MCF8393358.1 hemerythrin domain-containing protein [Melioribacteraceae bacterium]MCF8418923.1 hemerythrin domain-containing protein [Melioribacteraceae bacterium]